MSPRPPVAHRSKEETAKYLESCLHRLKHPVRGNVYFSCFVRVIMFFLTSLIIVYRDLCLESYYTQNKAAYGWHDKVRLLADWGTHGCAVYFLFSAIVSFHVSRATTNDYLKDKRLIKERTKFLIMFSKFHHIFFALEF